MDSNTDNASGNGCENPGNEDSKMTDSKVNPTDDDSNQNGNNSTETQKIPDSNDEPFSSGGETNAGVQSNTGMSHVENLTEITEGSVSNGSPPTVEPTADQTGGDQISNRSPATVEPTADQTGGGQISDGSPATVEATADQTGGVQISDGSPATVEATADQSGGGQFSDGSPAAVEPTADQTGGGQISDGSPATVEATADQSGGDQISNGSPPTVEPTAEQTGGGQIFDGSPATVEPTAGQAGGVKVPSESTATGETTDNQTKENPTKEQLKQNDNHLEETQSSLDSKDQFSFKGENNADDQSHPTTSNVVNSDKILVGIQNSMEDELQLQDELHSINNTINARKLELSSIEDQVKVYERKLQQQKTELESALEKLDNAKKECSRISSENEQVKVYENNLQQQRTELDNASKKLEETKQESRRLSSENEKLQNLQRTNKEQKEKISEYKQQILENGEQIKENESKLQQQQTQLDDKTEQFDEAKQECSRLSSENDVTVNNLSEELNKIQRTNEEQKEKILEYERQTENKEKLLHYEELYLTMEQERPRQEETINKFTEQVKEYETKLQQLKTQLENVSEYLEEAKQECMRLSTENEMLKNLERMNDEQNDKISEYERQILEIEEQVKVYESKLQQQQTQFEDITEQFDEAKQECSRLSSENEKLLHYEELYLTVELEKQQQEDTINQVTEQLHNSQMSCDKLREDITECGRQMSEKEDQLRDYESNYLHMKNQQENYQMELEQSKLQCTQLTSELARRNENDENNAYLHAMVVKSDKEKEMALAENTELNSTIVAANEEIAKLQEELQNREERMYELTQAMETERKSNEEYKGQQEATMAMMQTETEKYLITIRTNESNIERQRTETVSLYSQIQQLQGKLQGINLDLQKRDGELKMTLLARDQAKQNVLQHVEIINRLNTQLQSKEQEIQHIQDEINRTRVEGRELQLKYREMPEKEARFNCIEHENRTLLEENRELQERIKSLDPLQIQINFVRDENARLSWECQRYQDRCGYTDQKFRDLVTQLQQLTEENQMIRSNRIQLNRQLHQKVDEVETLERQLQDVVSNKENLERQLTELQTMKEGLERELEEIQSMSQEPPQQSQSIPLIGQFSGGFNMENTNLTPGMFEVRPTSANSQRRSGRGRPR